VEDCVPWGGRIQVLLKANFLPASFAQAEKNDSLEGWVVYQKHYCSYCLRNCLFSPIICDCLVSAITVSPVEFCECNWDL